MLLPFYPEAVRINPIIAAIPIPTPFAGRLFLSIKKDGQYLPNNLLNQIKLCYYDQAHDKITDLKRPEDGFNNQTDTRLVFSSVIAVRGNC